MKKLLLTGLMVGLAVSAFAQGQVNLDNLNNDPNAGPTATTGGLFFLDTGSGAVKIAQDFSISFYGGSDSANLVLLRTFSGATAAGDNAAGPGFFVDPLGVAATIPGATASAFMRIEAWLQGNGGNTFATAQYSRASSVFSNPVAQPPNTPPNLTGMPSVVLVAVPEPSTFALAGLGAAALFIFRRRK